MLYCQLDPSEEPVIMGSQMQLVSKIDDYKSVMQKNDRIEHFCNVLCHATFRKLLCTYATHMKYIAILLRESQEMKKILDLKACCL